MRKIRVAIAIFLLDVVSFMYWQLLEIQSAIAIIRTGDKRDIKSFPAYEFCESKGKKIIVKVTLAITSLEKKAPAVYVSRRSESECREQSECVLSVGHQPPHIPTGEVGRRHVSAPQNAKERRKWVEAAALLL